MKKEIILINGTQWRFLSNFLKGEIRDNTAFFIINKNINKNIKNKLFFTLQMSIYHAISLEVQDEIIKNKYKSFNEYYKLNKSKLPVICIYKGIGEANYINFQQLPYYMHKEKKIYTYPYIKYKDFKKHIKLELLNTLNLTENDFNKAEVNISQLLKCGNDRFFVKIISYIKKESLNNKINFNKYNFIDKEYIDLLTKILANDLEKKVMSLLLLK